MDDPIYVVTETVEIGPHSFEMLPIKDNLAGVYDDLCPALLALANGTPESDRRLYLAGFADGRLTLQAILIGIYYDTETKKHRFIDLT